MSNKQKKAYSLAEALVTMFIIVLVSIIIIPSIVGKRSKRVSYVIGPNDHGIIECKEGETCEFEPSEDNPLDIVVVATGGGGGGGGSTCGSDITHLEGSKEEDVKGTCAFSPNQVLWVEASAAGGASLPGMCDRYPGYFKANEHSYNCKWYPQATRTTTKQWCGTCSETTDKCLEYEKTCESYEKDEDGNDTSTCASWKETSTCARYEIRYYPCVKSSSSSVSGSCNYNSGNTSFCDDLPPDVPGGKCGDSSYTAEHTSVNKGNSQEVIKTGRGDVCSISWVLAEQNGYSHEAGRACNGAIFGGRGGSGQYFPKQRICPSASSSECQSWIEAHGAGSICSDEQIDQYVEEQLQGDCPLGAGYQLSNTVPIEMNSDDSFLGTIVKLLLNVIVVGSVEDVNNKCSSTAIAERMKEFGICGHPQGEHNCTEDHTGPMDRQCSIYNSASLNSLMVIGKAGVTQGQSANPTTLFGKGTVQGSASDEGMTIHEVGMANVAAQTLAGGGGGSVGAHGANGGGRGGGGHNPGDHFTDNPTPNNVLNKVGDGQVGFVECTTYWVDRGLGGEAGEIRTGYLKDTTGKVSIIVGPGGAGGHSSSGSNGGDVRIMVDGKEFATVKGGAGGTQERVYEECEAGDNGLMGEGYYTEGYPGQDGDISDTGYGTGGNGTSAVPGPNCTGSTGENGIPAGVVIFY